MRSLFLLPLALLFAGPVSAEEMRTAPAAILELFTSQGCTSCPPADALLSEFGARKDVIALAYHIDYWDYIGWRDTFGSPVFSDYQRAYATARGAARIYTPQLMVNGTKDVVGSRRPEIVSAIAEAHLPIPLSLNEHDGMITVSAKGNAEFPPAPLWLVTFKSKASVTISRGENQNRTIDYSYIATSRQVVGVWEPQSGASITLPVADLLGSKSDGAAILIQQDVGGRPGRILGGASFSR